MFIFLNFYSRRTYEDRGVERVNCFKLFVCNIEKLIIVWCISDKENHYDLTKNSPKFEASVTEKCISLSEHSGMFRQNFLKLPLKKLAPKKPFTTHELLYK